jgi:predicted nucleotidyltransferase
MAGAEQELSEIFGRPADLVERQCVERSENWIRRHILESARMIYVAR